MSTPRRRAALALALSLVAATAGLALVAGCGGDETRDDASKHAAGKPLHPVAGDFKPDKTRLSDCTNEHDCLEQAFGNVAYHQGPKAAIALFDRKIASDKEVEADCHRIAHTIGSAALARYDGNVGRAFAEGSSSCWSGYYHGILERALLGSSKGKLAVAARELCVDEELRESVWLAYQCVHGLGHGLMIHTGYDLPLSLKTCDRLATEWDQTSCTGGVFMENISTSYGVRSRWLKDDDLVYPCNVVAKRHKLYCYLMVTSRILQANGYDWRATASTCRTVERAWIATCFQSFGRDASGFTRQEPKRVAALCRVTGRWQGECLWGAARDMTANYQNTVRAASLCTLAPAGLRTRCFTAIGTIVGTLHAGSSDRRKACAVPARYLRACMRGAGESG